LLLLAPQELSNPCNTQRLAIISKPCQNPFKFRHIHPIPLTQSTILLKHLATAIHNHHIFHQANILLLNNIHLMALKCSQFSHVIQTQRRNSRELCRILQSLLSPRRMPNSAPQPSYKRPRAVDLEEVSYGVIQP